MIKTAETGKIINLITNDVNTIDIRLAFLMAGMSFPVYFVGITALLIIRVGWAALIGMVPVLLVLPVLNKISKFNSETIKEINEYKDKRVHTTTEIIEGIKPIKLYGWELAFRKIVKNLRDRELAAYRKLAFGKA